LGADLRGLLQPEGAAVSVSLAKLSPAAKAQLVAELLSLFSSLLMHTTLPYARLLAMQCHLANPRCLCPPLRSSHDTQETKTLATRPPHHDPPLSGMAAGTPSLPRARLQPIALRRRGAGSAGVSRECRTVSGADATNVAVAVRCASGTDTTGDPACRSTATTPTSSPPSNASSSSC